MKSKPFIILISAIICLTSCGAATPEVQTQTFLTGECLAGTEMSYIQLPSPYWPVAPTRFRFVFSLDISNYSNVRTDHTVMAQHYRKIPSDDLFKTFGSKQQAVRNEFERIFENYSSAFKTRYNSSDYSVITILYCGGISLIADKEFAGHKAGEDLADLITFDSLYDPLNEIADGEDPVLAPLTHTPSQSGRELELPLDYISILGAASGAGLPGVSFSIPMEDLALFSEQVTFELNIPVKVVRYLTWINDRLSNPNAPVPYEDEVLHCRFTTNYGLK